MQTDFSEEPYQRVVSFTCDGGRVVTGGGDGVVRVWEVRCVSVSVRERVVTGGGDGVVRVWEVRCVSVRERVCASD